jgi:hypothetical protein
VNLAEMNSLLQAIQHSPLIVSSQSCLSIAHPLHTFVFSHFQIELLNFAFAPSMTLPPSHCPVRFDSLR